jgi:hypothetical protein
MGRRTPLEIEKERQAELAAIWGSDVRGNNRRVPSWRGKSSSSSAPGTSALPDLPGDGGGLDADDAGSEISSLVSSNQDDRKRKKKEAAKKEASDSNKAAKKAKQGYRLHCFIEPGTSINDVREVFERYEPKVEIRTSQKGNLLNKVQYAALRFTNKAMALHAVKTLDGTNQRDLLGVSPLKLSMMLTREQNKILRRRLKKEHERAMRTKKLQQIEEDEQFLRKLVTGIREKKEKALSK